MRKDKSSLRILWITIVVSIGAGINATGWRTGHLPNEGFIVSYSGIVLIVIGLVIRWTAILSLRHQFTVDVTIRKDHTLITGGIYRQIRHPSYTGSLISFFGLGIAFSDYISVLLIFIPICAAFLYRIHIEEEALSAAFGNDYIEYCSRTKKLIPGIF
jgi:protein-S-isoprenylcysteine O-methyltransferase Ste14